MSILLSHVTGVSHHVMAPFVYLGCKQTIVHLTQNVWPAWCALFCKRERTSLFSSNHALIDVSDGTFKLFLLSEKENYVNESNILLMFPAVKREGRKSWSCFSLSTKDVFCGFLVSLGKLSYTSGRYCLYWLAQKTQIHS